MKSPLTVFALLIMLAILTGCASTNSVTRIPPAPPRKPHVAVLTFEVKTPSLAEQGESVAEGISDIFITELQKTDRFEVVERNRLDSVIDEQALGISGILDQDGYERIGKILNVEYIIIGSITEFGASENAFGASRMTFNSYNVRTVSDIRFVDATTGKVIFSSAATGEDASFGVSYRTGFLDRIDFGAAKFDETSIGKSIRKCMSLLATQTAARFNELPKTGKIARVDGNEYYINLGSSSGLAVGDTFSLVRKGEQILDPHTGEALGGEDDVALGSIRVVTVRERYAICSPVRVTGMVMIGDDIMQIPQ